MSLETRSSSALFKRAEQLRRWEESETNREPIPVNGRPKKIKFSAGCVFLAACKAGDKEEILRLLKKGADIDTHDVDGLSALHQACIDDNLELVEFLVENGADVNKGDNEGWTPLHATASCGFLSIARYLIEKGANVAAVNNDGELPADVAESNEMEDMLQQHLEQLGIDAEQARNEEERLMLSDAKNWLSSGYFGEKPHPRTGATALHVAAAKGYLKVMDILIKAGADVNAQDLDGWTPLHAAAHWAQKEAAEVLAEAHCDMGLRNCVGQTAFDVAENEMVRVLEDLRKKQASLPPKERRQSNNNKISYNEKPVISDRIESKEKDESDEDDRENSSSDKVPPVHQVELQIHSPPKQPPSETTALSKPRENQSTVDTDEDDDEVNSQSTETSGTNKSPDVSDIEAAETDKKNRVNIDDSLRLPVMTDKTVPNIQPLNSPSKENELEDQRSWKRPGSFRSRLQEATKTGLTPLKIGEKDSPTGTTPGATVSNARQSNAVRNETPQEVVLRRTQSFEADEKFYRRYLELRAKINAGNSCPALPSTPLRTASLKERRNREETLRLGAASPPSVPVSPGPAPTVSSASQPSVSPAASPNATSPQPTSQVRSVPSTPTTPGGSKLSPANIFKNFFKSFVPPVRDEESETQRKAHAKRVRETRRSTQGVTLEEIKSAEQLVKKKQQQMLQQASQQLGNSEPSDEVVVKVHREVPSAAVANQKPEGHPADRPPSAPEGSATPTVSATITRGANGQSFVEERRPSWRLKVDNGSKFMLEDARKTENVPTSNTTNEVVRRTAIAVPVTETGDTTVTLPLRKPKPEDEKDKDSESRNAQATQAAIQRRRRPKRRSTGVVHVDMDEIDPDRQSDGGTSPNSDGDYIIGNNIQSGGEISEPPSRNSEVRDIDSRDRSSTSNGEIDYKKLYEESLVENERLRGKLKLTEEELAQTKAACEKHNHANRNSMTETEKRERRAMERKLSEMEEELKQLQKLKSDNERLRAENRALTRVVSKLTSSHIK